MTRKNVLVLLLSTRNTPWSFFKVLKKNVFLESKLNLATFCNFSRIYTVTKNALKNRLLTISQKSLHKNFRRPIIFSKLSESSWFFFARLAQPLNPFGIKNLLHHTSCCGSRWNIPKKKPFVNNVNMTLKLCCYQNLCKNNFI